MNDDSRILAKEADYSLLVPYALTVGNLPVGAKHADRSTTYFCPECRKEVRLRVPRARRRRHFAHRHENANCPFQTEQKRRVVAKHMIYWAFYAWVTGQEPPPVLIRKCPGCRRSIRKPVSGTIVHVERDYREADGTPSLDVALLNAEKIVRGAVIVYDSHATSRCSLENYGSLPALLVHPKEFLLGHGAIPVYRESNTRQLTCPTCTRQSRRTSAMNAAIRQIDSVASRRTRVPESRASETAEANKPESVRKEFVAAPWDDETTEESWDETPERQGTKGVKQDDQVVDENIDDDSDDQEYDPLSVWNRPRPVRARSERTLHVFPLPEPEPAPVEPPADFDPDIVRRGVICEDGNYRCPTRPDVVGCPLARNEGDPKGLAGVNTRCVACEHFRGYDNHHPEKGLSCSLKEPEQES